MALNPRFYQATLLSSVAMTAPAARMVVVEVSAGKRDGEWWYESDVFPVLAIVAKDRRTYLRSIALSKSPPPLEATHEEMLQEGWQYDDSGSGLHFDVLIHDPKNFGLCEAGSALDGENIVFDVVVCGWPAEHDAESLQPIIERLKFEARRKVDERLSAHS
jgi:hypothetical protein